MAESPSNQIVQFVPTNDEPMFGQESLDALQDALDPNANRVDLIVTQATPAPLGRAPKFDFAARAWERAPGAQGPVMTHGNETLKNWIEKCLSTARGAHPIHPPGYGLQRPEDLIGGPVTEVPADLTQRITDALTFHPRIANVTDFAFDYDPSDDYLAVSFTVVTDRDETVQVDSLLVTP